MGLYFRAPNQVMKFYYTAANNELLMCFATGAKEKERYTNEETVNWAAINALQRFLGNFYDAGEEYPETIGGDIEVELPLWLKMKVTAWQLVLENDMAEDEIASYTGKTIIDIRKQLDPRRSDTDLDFFDIVFDLLETELELKPVDDAGMESVGSQSLVIGDHHE